MALSDDERRLLAQLEAALTADDPKLAHTLRGTSSRRVHRQRLLLAGLAFAVGIAALVAGIETHPVVSVLGFLVMLASAIVALSAWARVAAASVQAQRQPRPEEEDSSFLDFEDRWRRPEETP